MLFAITLWVFRRYFPQNIKVEDTETEQEWLQYLLIAGLEEIFASIVEETLEKRQFDNGMVTIKAKTEVRILVYFYFEWMLKKQLNNDLYIKVDELLKQNILFNQLLKFRVVDDDGNEELEPMYSDEWLEKFFEERKKFHKRGIIENMNKIGSNYCLQLAYSILISPFEPIESLVEINNSNVDSLLETNEGGDNFNKYSLTEFGQKIISEILPKYSKDFQVTIGTVSN